MKKHKTNYTVIILTFAFILFWNKGYSMNYYVSNTGNDTAIGTSPGTAWKTISHVNSQTFIAGDSILFKRGDYWRQQSLTAPSSGSNLGQIVFGAYGEGSKPKIYGSVQANEWTNVSGNIWQSATKVNYNPKTVGYGAEVFFVEADNLVKWGNYQIYSDLSELTEQYDWTWNSETLYIYAESDPDILYTSVEAPQIANAVLINDKEYLSFDNLEIMYYTQVGIRESYAPPELHGLRVTNCHIGCLGVKGSAQAFGLSVKQSDMYIAYNDIHDCGRRNISINLYDVAPVITMQNVIIENNHLHNGWHTTGIDGINSGTHTMKNITIRNNIIENGENTPVDNANPYSNAIYIVADPGAEINNVKIYNNVFKYIKGAGIVVDGVDSMLIYYNTFYGHNQNVNVNANFIHTTALHKSPTHVDIRNNLFYNTAPGTSPYSNCIYIDYNTYSEMDFINNNIYWGNTPTKRLVNIYQSGVIDEVYNANNFSDWITNHGFDINSPTPSDPQFIQAPDELRLSPGSPAIEAGVSIPGITTDFLGNLRNPEHPTIGAYEYDPNIPNTIENINHKNDIFTYYPNPAANSLTLELSDIINDKYNLQLYNIQGIKVYEREFSNNKKQTIEIANFSPGIYFIKVVSGNLGIKTAKIIIQ